MPSPYAMPQVVAKARRILLRKDPDTVFRLGAIATATGFLFTVSQFRAEAMLEDDVACALVEAMVDNVADKFKCDVRVCAPDGTLLYWRMGK